MAAHPAADALLFVLAVLEATLFPAPTEALFVAIGLARARPAGAGASRMARAWPVARLGLIATVGSLVGALIGYAIGAEYFERLGRPLLARLGVSGEFDAVGALYTRNALVALLTSGYTPIPYVLYTVTAGATPLPIPVFVVGSLAGRGIKYALLGLVTFHAGPAVQAAFRRATGWTTAALATALLLWWWLGR